MVRGDRVCGCAVGAVTRRGKAWMRAVKAVSSMTVTRGAAVALSAWGMSMGAASWLATTGTTAPAAVVSVVVLVLALDGRAWPSGGAAWSTAMVLVCLSTSGALVDTIGARAAATAGVPVFVVVEMVTPRVRLLRHARTHAALRAAWPALRGSCTAVHDDARLVQTIATERRAGWVVRWPTGAESSPVGKILTSVSSAMRVGTDRLRVRRYGDAGTVEIVAVQPGRWARDGLRRTWPEWMAATPRPSLTRGVSVGRDVSGREVWQPLMDRTLLVAGETGGGKSSFLRAVIAQLLMIRHVVVIVADGKGGAEAMQFAGAVRVVASMQDDMPGVLDELHTEMERRWQSIAAAGRVDVEVGADMPMIVLVVDELAALPMELHGRLQGLMARGRAARIVVIAATQNLHGKLIDTTLRALFTDIVCLPVSRPDQHDIAFGPGSRSPGFDASAIGDEITGSTRGHAVMRQEGRQSRIQCWWLELEDARQAAAWAAPTRPARVPPAFLPTPLPAGLPTGTHGQTAPMAALTGGPLPAVEGMDSGRVETVIAAVSESAGPDGWAATAAVRQQVGAPSDSTWHRWVAALERSGVVERGDRGRRVRRVM